MSGIDLDADIVPARGLGGLVLGTRATDILDDLLSKGIEREWVSQTDLRYHLGDGEVEAGFWVPEGRLNRLTAREGYRGRLLGAIAVGMPIALAILAEPRLRRMPRGDAFVCDAIPGFAIEVRRVESGEEVIDGIAVFRD